MSTIPGTNLTAPVDYYNRHDSTTAGGTHGEVFEEHLLIAGRVGQSAEINEIQSRTRARIAALGYHLLNDGDIKSGGELTINSGPTIPGGNAGMLSTPSFGMVRVLCERSEIWLDGAERIVPERTIQVPNNGLVIVGVYLRQEIVSYLAEPALRDPAIGLRMQGEAGADRLKVTAFWGYDGDGQADGVTKFFPVHRLLNGVLQERSLSPEASTISNAIARYDRQSTGGSYIVKGFRVTAIPPVVPEGQDPQATALESLQRYSLEMGEARIFGAEIITDGGQYIEWQARPDTEAVLSEPHDSVAEVSQVVGINRAPASELSTVLVQVKITNEAVARSTVPNQNSDTLSQAVSGFYEVRQGETIYAENTDYRLSSGKIEWISANRPVGQYYVDYRYKKNLTNDTALSPTGLFVTLPATLGAGESYVALANGIELTYRTQLPRIDRICLDRFGQYHIIRGIPGRYGEQPAQPRIPTELLPLCSIYQTWIPATRRVSNDGPRMVSMARLESHDRDISNLYNLVATSLLHASAEAYTAKDALGRRGLFLDAFRDDAARDPGVEQTAQITRGTLTLGVEVTVYSGTLGEPVTLRRGADVVQVEQMLSSESMQINPYLVFTPPVSRAVLTPKFDFWTTSITKILPPKYVDVYRYVDWFTKGPVPFDPGIFRPDPGGWSPPPFNWDDWELMHKDTKLVGEESGGTEEFTSSQEAPFMREITIRFRLDNWPNGERLKTVTIDGVPVAFEAL